MLHYLVIETIHYERSDYFRQDHSKSYFSVDRSYREQKSHFIAKTLKMIVIKKSH